MAERFDVFVSYAHRDKPEWVEALASNLHQRGFEVFLDAWEIGAGDVLVHRLDEGILESRHAASSVRAHGRDAPAMTPG